MKTTKFSFTYTGTSCHGFGAQIKGLSSSSCDLIDIKAGKTIQVKACSSLHEDDKAG